MDRYYPIALNIKGKKCLVVGGGAVAYRKILRLLECGADVRVVAPDAVRGIEKLVRKGSVKFIKRAYRRDDLRKMYLVYAATDDSTVNKRIFSDARSMRVLVNVVDAPAYCDFIMPAVLRKGGVTITISTDGSAPYASVLVKERLKKRIDKLITPEYVKLLNIVISTRNRLMTMKKQGMAIDIEKMLGTVSLSRLLHFIRGNDQKAVKTYIDGIVRSGIPGRG